MQSIPFIRKLITEDTPILKLPKDSTSISDKYSELGFLSSRRSAIIYASMMYFFNNAWYYFKVEEDKVYYPFYLIDELMGSYLARFINLDAVSYSVASIDGCLGLASRNFKKDGFDYYFSRELSLDSPRDFTNIHILESLCIDDNNAQALIQSILKLFALDIYMLQTDRCCSNLQFQVSKINQAFSLAPLYDFSNCSSSVKKEKIIVPNVILSLNDTTIPMLCRNYPRFSEYLSILLEHKMSVTWDQICQDYHFNQDCFAYIQIKDYYQIKEEKQKEFLKKYLTR